jgi:DNA-binding NarL/FixJ family response regulator
MTLPVSTAGGGNYNSGPRNEAAQAWPPRVTESNAMKRPRVLLADDHRMLREAFAQLLEPTCEIVGCVADGRALLAAAAEHCPDIVIADISMPQLNGLDATRQLKRSQPQLKVIVLTVNEDPALAAEAFRAGACSYLLKNSAVAELQKAVEVAMQGQSYVTPLVAEGMLEALASPETSARREVTSPRQREVLQLIAEGCSMKKVAKILKIKPRTVAFHKYGMMKHLGVKSTAELVQAAIRMGVVAG